MKYDVSSTPEVMTIVMEGDFTFQDSHFFKQILKAVKKDGAGKEIRIHMGELSSMDSTALRLFMLAHDLSKQLHSCLFFDQPKGQVLRSLNEAAQWNVLNIAA
ncbi:MAG: STAS domain-containing protein [Bdellovibrionales bacterium]|jgi:anti-anti-sigma regulatory factor